MTGRRRFFHSGRTKPQDLWVGVFWRRERAYDDVGFWLKRRPLDVWVCLLPMLPIHFGWTVEAAL